MKTMEEVERSTLLKAQVRQARALTSLIMAVDVSIRILWTIGAVAALYWVWS